MNFNNDHQYKQQRGTVLIVTMLILIVLTLIVLAGSRQTTMQLRMSTNLQSRVDAVEQAQAGLDYAETIPGAKIPVAAQVLCTENNPDGYSCYPDPIILPAPMDSSSDGTSSLVLIRDNLSPGGCPREGTSASTFECAYFKAISTFDDTANGQGRSTVNAGLIKKTLK